MKKHLRALTAGVLTLLTLTCLLPSTVLAASSLFSGLIRPTKSPYVGTVVITKAGYQNARQSSADATTVWRVHYGERYLCVADTGNGWYEILLPTEETAFISSNPENTTLLRDQTDDVTLSTLLYYFKIRADKKLDLYSQPKTSAQSRRVSNDGSTETTFSYPKGTELTAFGMTTRGGKDWYLLICYNDGVLEPGWVLASDCTVIYGIPDENVIPDWWYD